MDRNRELLLDIKEEIVKLKKLMQEMRANLEKIPVNSEEKK